MNTNQLQGLTFIKCRNPTYFVKNGVKNYTSCGHCDICNKTKADKYSMSLQLEERHHIYSFFITLTYNDEFIPRYEICDNNAYWTLQREKTRVEKSSDKFHVKQKEVCRFDMPLQSVTLKPAFMRLYSIKGTDEYVLRDATDYDSIRTQINPIHLQTYYKHRDLYVQKYSQTGVEYPHGYIDLCPKRDLETFMLRLKNYAVRKCNKATFRYFAVPDYGTNSLRPHWHILLFTHSHELGRAFLKTANYGSSERPSYAATFLPTLWQYGICNSSRIEKSAASYVASYLNKSSYDAIFVDNICKQRCYHSSHLGAVLPKEDIKNNIVARNFSYFENLRDYTYDGVEYEYRWRSALMYSFLPRLPYIDPKNVNGVCQITRWLCSFISRCQRLSSDVTFTCIASALYDYVDDKPEVPQWLRDYKNIQDNVGDYYNRDINLFYRLILSACHFVRMQKFFGVSLTEVSKIVRDYTNYKEYNGLKTLYTALEEPALSDAYYKNLLSDFENNSNNVFYQAYLSDNAERIANNIKHKEVADKYRFNN